MELKKAIEVLNKLEFEDYEYTYNGLYHNIDTVLIKQAFDTVLEELNNYKLLIKSAKRFIEDNSHEFICKRDGGLPELEFDNNTNASDLLDILDGNY